MSVCAVICLGRASQSKYICIGRQWGDLCVSELHLGNLGAEGNSSWSMIDISDYAGAAAVQPSAKELSPDLASFRSPMQFGLSRLQLQQDAQLQNVAPQAQKSCVSSPSTGQIPKIRLPARPGQGTARSATDGWGVRRQSND